MFCAKITSARVHSPRKNSPISKISAKSSNFLTLGKQVLFFLVLEADKAVADRKRNALDYGVIAQFVLDALLIAINGIG